MTLRIHCITVLPEMFSALTGHGVVGRAFERGLVQLQCWNPRDFTVDNYHRIDDRPYGGGPGMVMMAEPLERCLAAIGAQGPQHILMMSPQGARLDHAMAQELVSSLTTSQRPLADALLPASLPASLPALTLLCGRYEGVDQRLLDRHKIREVSVGDFVVSGGELPAMLMIDALVRLLPGALNDEQSAQTDSFVEGLLDFPHYTRPEVWNGVGVPPVLLSGNHANIERWRRQQALLQTWTKRPDLIALAHSAGRLSRDDLTFLSSLGWSDGALPG